MKTKQKRRPHLLSKIVARTHKEEVADDVANHLLVEVAVVDVLPVRVLQVRDDDDGDDGS